MQTAIIEPTTLTAEEEAILMAELTEQFNALDRAEIGCVGNCESCVWSKVCDF